MFWGRRHRARFDLSTHPPPLHTPLRVQLPGRSQGLTTRIRSLAGRGLVITRPGAIDDPPPPRDAELQLSWAVAEALCTLRVRYLGAAAEPEGCWRVEALGPVERAQRRDGYRVPLMGRVALRTGGRTLPASLIDLSEGGLRCLLDGDAVPAEGDDAVVELDVVQPGLVAPATIVRVRESIDAMVDVAAQFDPLPDATVQLLRRFVFAEQIDQGGDLT